MTQLQLYMAVEVEGCCDGYFAMSLAVNFVVLVMWWLLVGLFLIIEFDNPGDRADALEFFYDCWGDLPIAVPVVECECC